MQSVGSVIAPVREWLWSRTTFCSASGWPACLTARGSRVSAGRRGDPLTVLGAREREVLALMAEG